MERSREDARVVLVHLTDAGRELIETSFAAHAAHLDSLFENLDSLEREQFASLMRKVGHRAQSLNG